MSSIDIRLTGITDLDTDCIVNAANSGLAMGSGVCGAIFRAAGPREMQAACDKIGGCPTGGAVITTGFALKAKHVVHAVGPIWKGGKNNEGKNLYNCYRELFLLGNLLCSHAQLMHAIELERESALTHFCFVGLNQVGISFLIIYHLLIYFL